MYWEVKVRIEASVPEDKDSTEWASELRQALENAEERVVATCNWAEVQSNGIRVKVSTP